MRALVTGASGFVGQWLCRELLERGWEVTGTHLEETIGLGALGDEARRAVRWTRCDVLRPDDLQRVVDGARPEAIFHLAGISFVPTANADPARTLEVNVIAAARLLAEVRRHRAAGTLDPVVLVIGSGEQYGRHDPEEQPLPEGAEQRAQSIYAASKAAQEIVALEAHRAAGVRVIATRSFNHSGPGQAERFLLPALVRRALALRGRHSPSLVLGNTTPVRDFLHVADVVRAYVGLAERGAPGEAYNVASGVGHSVAAVAERVLAVAAVGAKLQVDPALVRPVEVPVLIGSPARLQADTGWAPRFTLDTIIEDLIRATAQ